MTSLGETGNRFSRAIHKSAALPLLTPTLQSGKEFSELISDCVRDT